MSKRAAKVETTPAIIYRHGEPTYDKETGERKKNSARRLRGSTHPEDPNHVLIPAGRITDRENGLVYEVTLGRGNGRVWINGLSIFTMDPQDRIGQDTIRGLSLREMQERAASVIEGMQTKEGLAELLRDGAPPPKSERPSPELVAELMDKGWTRRDFAKHFGRELSTVDDWRGEARAMGLTPATSRTKVRKTTTKKTTTKKPSTKPSN